MEIICPVCGSKDNLPGKKKWHSPKCKKAFENAKRSIPQTPPGSHIPRVKITCPDYLNPVAAQYWRLTAPTVEARGHLNILSMGAFAELCDVYSKLLVANMGPDDEEKRKYSKLFMDYCKQFYLTPLSNKGNFGLQVDEPEVKEKEKEGSGRFFK